MKNSGKKFKQFPLLFSGVFFVVALGAFLFLYQEIRHEDARAEALRLEVENEVSKRERARTLESFLESSESERAELDKHFVYRTDVVPFLRFVENLGPEVGAEVEISSVEITRDGSDLFVEARAAGTFESVHKFFRLLENAPYKVEFVALNLSAGSGSGGAWQGSARMKILTFIP